MFDIFGVDGILLLFINQIILLLFATDHGNTLLSKFINIDYRLLRVHMLKTG